MKPAYTIPLNNEDWESIHFVGYRYGWSNALLDLGHCPEEPALELTEPQAWELVDAINSDTEGGHRSFPMLNHRSDLAEKLFSFLESVV